jgi:hypothetical protein
VKKKRREIVLPPDCETAVSALARQLDHHMKNAETTYLSKRVRVRSMMQAERAIAGIGIINSIVAQIRHQQSTK